MLPALTPALSALSQRIAADLRARILAPGPAQDRARQLHAEERVGADFAVWTDLLSRRAAVLWVLRSVYVRVLEDRGLLRPLRIVDAESQQLFERLAPNLGQTAYLRWVYRDLASAEGGLPELFAPQPAEVALPSDALSRELLAFWRERDPDTGTLRWSFADAHFDGRLMGDLYEDLDPIVRDRFALCQTPDFILDFILDETLTPAIAEWGVENVRLIDPACGSGHFLLAGFKRLVAGMREKFPERGVREIVLDVLKRVVGLDLNDYACALARARLVMTALELCGESDLAAASAFHPQVYWTDALEQVERDEWTQLGLAMEGTGIEKPRAMLTRPEVRTALRPLLKQGFHAVVGNPPYITEKDARQKEYHRQKVGKGRRYLSASREYSLGAPFTERMFQLATEDGFVGEITANSFMKSDYGRALIEDVIAQHDLTLIVDSSGLVMGGHGTPTVLLFFRNRRPRGVDVPVVMKKRGAAANSELNYNRRIWSSILRARSEMPFEDEYVSTAILAQASLHQHEWSIGGGGAAELVTRMSSIPLQLGDVTLAIGAVAVTREDDAFAARPGALQRLGVREKHIRRFAEGSVFRNWTSRPRSEAVFPYEPIALGVLPANDAMDIIQFLWRFRSSLRIRAAFKRTQTQRGLMWYEYSMLFASRMGNDVMQIAVPELASHSHFVRVDPGDIVKDTAPVLVFDRQNDIHAWCALALGNASVASFFLRQKSRDKGTGGIDRGVSSEAWSVRFEFGGGKVASLPLASVTDSALEFFAKKIDSIAQARSARSVQAEIDTAVSDGALALRGSLDRRRRIDLDALFEMAGLQEELDWYCYKLYAIAPGIETRAPDAVPPLVPGTRPFEIALARREAEKRAVAAHEAQSEEAPTAWFTLHGWEPHTTMDAFAPDERRIAEDRLARAAAFRDLDMLEQPTYKRRWYRPDYEKEEKEALTEWLSDRIEDYVKARMQPWTVAQVALALGGQADVRAVCEVLTGRADYDVEALIGERVRAESVPNNKHHVFKPDGLIKRAAWEETWAQQHLEDAGKPAAPAVPPKYGSVDYLRGEYWSQRGKLDVPKERFIAFTEVPGAGPSRYGWAGWTHRERARVLVDFDEQLENDGIAVEDRIGVLYGVWFLLPWVRWESVPAADEFRAIVQAAVGRDGVTEAMLAQWAATHPPGGVKEPKAAKEPKVAKEPRVPRSKKPKGES